MPKLRNFIVAGAGFVALALLAGCGGNSSAPSASAPGPGPAQVSVAIAPASSTNMIGGAAQTFTAAVANDASNAGVTWAASVGSITASGVYTAPAPVKVAQATVTATSKSDPSKSASANITLMAISVSIGPATLATMGSGASQALTATVANDGSNGGVTWTVNGGGSFSASNSLSGAAVTYTAPSPVSTFTAVVTATSVTDPSRAVSAVITLAGISLNPISPTSASLGTGGTQVFTDSVANDGSNSGVSWSITAGPGTLSAASGAGVTYNAPTTVINAATPVTLTATSIKDPTKSTTANITLNRISVAITPTNPLAMLGGGTQAFTATVANDGTNAGVIWTVTGGGSFSAGSTLSGAATTYTAASPVAGTSATLTATSKTDATKSASATVMLTAISISLTSASAVALDGNGAQTFAVSASITGDASASGATFVVSGASGTGGTMSASPVTGNAPGAVYTTPVVSAQTSATITVASVKDPTKIQIVTVTLNPPLSFTTPPGALTAAAAGTAYTGAGIVVAGGTGTRTFSITSGALPAGLTLSATGAITGVVTGAAGTSNFTVQVVDQSGTPATISGGFNIAVGSGPPVWLAPTAGTQTFTLGTAISPIALSTTGGTGAITYSVSSGTLPQGLQIVGGQVTGTPTSPTVVAGNAVTFLATDSSKPIGATAVSSSVTFVANPVALAITSTGLPGATVGLAYSNQLTSTGGTGAITWTLTAGSLTGTGMTLSSTGLLSGTPTVAEAAVSLTFQAQDTATNQQQTKAVILTLSIAGPLVITTAGSLPTAPANAAYSQTLAAAGGSGSGYAWTVTAGSNSLAALNLSVSGAGVITGTPTLAGTANFTVQVKDTANNTASGSFSVSTAPALSLPAPNPASLGAGTITTPYTGAITASGGIAGYTWTVNGGAVSANGSVSLVDNLTVTNSGGGATLSVSGTPTATGTVSFTASVKDSTGSSAGPFTYTVAVGNFFTVGGQINSQVGCNTSGLTGVLVSINTNPVQTTTTSANGSFSFINVPNGTYIITPTISGSSSAFYPATQTVVVNSNNLSAASFTATLGYTVSGTVAYTGTHAGQIYLALNPTGNCGGRSPGTSLTSKGAYSIRGVPPGNYTLQAFMDTVDDGVPNAANPRGSTPGVSPTTANISGVDVTLSDPAAVTLTTAPTLTSVAPFNSGVFVQYKPITNSVGLEMASYYTFQWSISPTFASIDGSKRFPANGTHSNVWLLRGLTNGSVYYFRAYGTSAGTLVGPSSQILGPIVISAPTVGNVVTGSVSFATPATGPLYVGYYDQGSGTFYGQYIVSPVSAQPFTIQVPSGYDYVLLGVMDQNNDGAIGANDITNTGNGSSLPVTAILGATANQSLTLPNTDGIAAVTTQNFESVTSLSALQNYNINFTVNGLNKRPVAVALTSGQNLITPVDIAICGGSGSTCGQGFQISFNLYGTSPTVGDNYVFDVTYSDHTTGTLNAAVTAVLNGFAANLSPQTGTSVSTTPTFTWTDPLSAASYTYQFNLTDSNSNVIWQVPQTNAASNGFSSAITTIAWGIDPSGGGSAPTVPSLTLGTTYSWQITVQDSNGNSTATQVQYKP